MFALKLCCISQEDEYVTLAAMHYCIQFGAAYTRDNMQQVVEECIADKLIESRGMAKWIDLISSAHLQVRWRLRLQLQVRAVQVTPV